MTEAEWLAALNPEPMLRFLSASMQASPRKLQLYAVACCRIAWPWLVDEEFRKAVEVAERSADGLATEAERAEAAAAADARLRACYRRRGFMHSHQEYASIAAKGCVSDAGQALSAASLAVHAAGPGADVVQAVALHDIFGPLPLPEQKKGCILPEWLGWSDGIVVRLAQAANEERLLPSGHLHASHLACLGDVLEAAGCDDAEILSHCRPGQYHVRGCWVVDLLLSRE